MSTQNQRPMSSILPSGMDGRPRNGTYPEERPANGVETSRSLGRGDEPAYSMQRASMRKTTIRTVTPENRVMLGDNLTASPTSIQHSSPRSIPGGEKPKDRRGGLVFEDAYRNETPEAKRSGPPVSFQSSSRPRTRTLDESNRHRSTSNSVSKTRHRIGSVNSTSASPFHDVEPRVLADSSNSLGFPSVTPRSQLSKSNSVKGSRKLTKRAERTSRPTTPLPAMMDIPSVDSLTSPIPTGDANKILLLMKTLCGRMRGEVEYQASDSGAWYTGSCYIDEAKGCLMHAGEHKGQFHITIIPDLRACQVRPTTLPDRELECLEITNHAQGVEVWLVPLVKAEFDLWLAALLCWQQIRNGVQSSSPPNTGYGMRPGMERRNSSFVQLNPPEGSKGPNIIKVAQILLWDKGAAYTPRAVAKRPSTRDLKSASRSSWRKVSCILQDNGEVKLLTENDITLLSVIQLSQLSRCAIQRLDRTVLDEDFCIAIRPQYTSTSTQLSIIRPVYIALESRLAYEVWFCLLRAFTIPEIYGPQTSDDDEIGIPDIPANDDMFRIEKTLNIRVVEAKMRKPVARPDTSQGRTLVKAEPDPLIGDYFAEVLLDGELRAKTNVKTDTRNPFWREDCEFHDLPSYTPKLSVTLKRLQRPEPSTHAFLSSSTLNSPIKTTEVVCGTVEVPVDKLERGKDNEIWWPIIDDGEEQIGEIFLKVRREEIVVLLSKEYEEISKLLHKFENGLTIQIAQSAPSHLKPLAETLMNIFQVSGYAGDWLKALVEDEIDGIGKENNTIRRARWSRRIPSNESFTSVGEREQNVRDIGKSLQGEANLLFRGNSLLTQALDANMRRLGKEYLEEVLSERVAEINALNSDCEVDPSRIAQLEDVNKNWALLISLTTKVWKGIADSAARCPPELRHILKYIRGLADERYGNFLRTVAYTSVSGFLFLRFFCPALLNPKLFGLLRDHPRPKAQRALTLVAKSLQALANLSTFGAKEPWMEPMNKFLQSHRQGVKDYIDNVCDIPAEKTTFTVPASYSTPLTILARLPPTSREGFPSLPYLIDPARNFAILVKLWLEATSRYEVPPDREGDILKFNSLCIALQHRTDECLLKASHEDRSADQLSLQWEDLVESLESSSILQEVTTADSNDIYPTQELHRRDTPGSAGSEVLSASVGFAGGSMSGSMSGSGMSGSGSGVAGGKDKKDRQSFWESTFGKESKYQRPYEPMEGTQGSPPNLNLTRGSSRSGGGGGSGGAGGGAEKKQAGATVATVGRGFLNGLRRKGTKDGKDGKDVREGREGEGF